MSLPFEHNLENHVESRKRCTVFLNGNYDSRIDMYLEASWDLDEFLAAGSRRLGMPSAATVAYTADGYQVEDYELITDDDLIAFSAGEAFIPIKLSDTVLPPDIPPIIGPYIIGNFLVGSRFGEWREGVKRTDGSKFALRLLKKDILRSVDTTDRGQTGGTILDKISREYQVLTATKHSNIVNIHMRLEVPKFIVMAYDLMEGGDLKSLIISRGTVPNAIALGEDQAKSTFRQVLSAVSYLHGNNITHKDVKLEVLLLQTKGSLDVVKLSGFHLAESSSATGHMIDRYVGTVAYMAPEVFKEKTVAGPPVDVWAMGVVLFTLLCGHLPFGGTGLATNYEVAEDSMLYRNVKENIILNEVEISDNLSRAAKRLLNSMLCTDPEKRISSSAIFTHKWMRDSSEEGEAEAEEDEEGEAEEASGAAKDAAAAAAVNAAVAAGESRRVSGGRRVDALNLSGKSARIAGGGAGAAAGGGVAETLSHSTRSARGNRSHRIGSAPEMGERSFRNANGNGMNAETSSKAAPPSTKLTSASAGASTQAHAKEAGTAAPRKSSLTGSLDYFARVAKSAKDAMSKLKADLSGNKKSAEDVIKSSDLSRRRARRSFRESESRRSMSELHRDRDDARSHCEGLLDCLDDGIQRVHDGDGDEDDPYARVRARFKEGVSVSIRQNAAAHGTSASTAESQSAKVSFSAPTVASVSLDNSRKGPNSESMGRLARVANQNIVS